MDGAGPSSRSRDLPAGCRRGERLLRARSAGIAWVRDRLAETRATSAEPYARPLHPRSGAAPPVREKSRTSGCRAARVWRSPPRSFCSPASSAPIAATTGRRQRRAALGRRRSRQRGGHARRHRPPRRQRPDDRGRGALPRRIGEHTSVLFFDPLAARDRLKRSPWIADATIRKLYPDQLMVTIVERQAFARWQRDGKIVVIAADGTVIVPHFDARFRDLPLGRRPRRRHPRPGDPRPSRRPPRARRPCARGDAGGRAALDAGDEERDRRAADPTATSARRCASSSGSTRRSGSSPRRRLDRPEGPRSRRGPADGGGGPPCPRGRGEGAPATAPAAGTDT